MTDDAGPLPKLPPRAADSHKGTHGTALILGGCARPASAMLGAPTLTARAALRAGVGLARLLVPKPLLIPALEQIPEATAIGLAVDRDLAVIPHDAAETLDHALTIADCLAVGPGLGPGDEAESLSVRALGQQDVPVVADADALNALARIRSYPELIRAATIITPHPGEFARLTDRLGMATLGKRDHDAAELARRLGIIVVLKGAGTVVTDGLRTWTCRRGHPCLAVGGTGDVLTGVIAALVAQHVAPGPQAIGSFTMPKPPDKPLDLFDAARLGVEAHAIAGERWAETHEASSGLLARELADLMPSSLERL
ncbi:MAG: NAD(P)H-hydrate dehydratase [Planctomycetota bacterium]